MRASEKSPDVWVPAFYLCENSVMKSFYAPISITVSYFVLFSF
jgi:hypothetical protein